MGLPRRARPGQHLLDVGCGLGLQTKCLAQRGLRITGLDTSEEAILFARRLAAPVEQFFVKSIFELDGTCCYDYVRMENICWNTSMNPKGS